MMASAEKLIVVVPDGITALAKMICGCVDDDAWRVIKQHLINHRMRDDDDPADGWLDKTRPIDGNHWIVLSMLDGIGLVNHSGNLWSSCFTQPDGEDVIAFLDEWGLDWRDSRDVRFMSTNGEQLNAA